MKRNKIKINKKTIIFASILAVIIIVAGFVVADELKYDVDKGYHEITDMNELEDLEIEVKSSDDYVEPAEGTLNVSKIQGFSLDSSTESAEENTQKISLSDPNLTVEAIGSYAGNFLEDGSDEPTANVAAMLITNNSDRMLQIAEITFQVNDTETASFKVTNLPAGTSTLVLESNKREFSEEDSYTYGETATGYMDEPTLEEDKFELVTEKGKIILKNKTNESYDKVYVYYKYVQIGGAYLGGITYRTPFENVPAGGEVEAIAAHFNPESSQLMAVQIQSE